MRRLLLALMLLALPSLAFAWGGSVMVVGGGPPAVGGGIAYIQGKRTAVISNASSAQVTWDSNTVSGHGVVVLVAFKATSITSVTDNQSNTYTDSGAGRVARPTDGYVQIFTCPNITGGTTPTVTVTFDGFAQDIVVFVHEYSGQNTAGMVDTGIYASGTATSGTTAVTGNLTPSTTNGAIVAIGWGNAGSGSNISFSDGVAYTTRLLVAENPYGEGTSDRIFSSSPGTVAVTATFGGTVTKAVVLAVALKAE